MAEFVIGMVLYYWFSPFGSLSDTKLSSLQIVTLVSIVMVMTLNLAQILLVPLFGLLIASSRDDKGILSRILALPILLWLGRISYSLYITHYIFIRMFDAPWGRLFPELLDIGEVWKLGFIVIEAILMLAFAHLTYTLVEVPGRRWIQSAVTAKTIN